VNVSGLLRVEVPIFRQTLKTKQHNSTIPPTCSSRCPWQMDPPTSQANLVGSDRTPPLRVSSSWLRFEATATSTRGSQRGGEGDDALLGESLVVGRFRFKVRYRSPSDLSFKEPKSRQK
jgi:hypothetical protein